MCICIVVVGNPSLGRAAHSFTRSVFLKRHCIGRTGSLICHEYRFLWTEKYLYRALVLAPGPHEVRTHSSRRASQRFCATFDYVQNVTHLA
eukprot:jgi/Botrbrau1/11923/Bobra.0259s0012.1